MIAIIPARGGSKGIPNKNIKQLSGKPLIAYTIEAAKNAKSLKKIILSTDDQEIAKIARNYGVEVPFMRPKELATDDALAIDNYIYTIERLNSKLREPYESFVVLQPTSPLRTALDIDNAVRIFRENNADSVVSVSEAPYPPAWAERIDQQGILRPYFNGEGGVKNRQQFDQAYVPNGAVYVFKYALLKEKHSYYSERTYPYIMPQERSIDIDVNFDFNLAKFLLGQR